MENSDTPAANRNEMRGGGSGSAGQAFAVTAERREEKQTIPDSSDDAIDIDIRIFGSRLKSSQNVGYNLGKALEVFVVATIANLAMPFYTITLGVSPALIGLALLAPRLLDAFTDPLMGWISDNTRSRWGRRRPWMFLGGILTGVFFWLIWTPPIGWGKYGLWIYFLVTSMLFYIASTIYLIPYYALGNEISMDPLQRVNVMKTRSLIWGVSTLAAPWAYSLYYNPLFGKTAIEGARNVGLMIGIIAVAFGVISAVSGRENPSVQTQPRLHFISAVKDSLTLRPFWIMLAIVTLNLFGFGLVGSLGMFVGTYYIYNGDQAAMAKLWGYLGMSWGIGAVCFSLFAERLINAIGEKATIHLSSLLIVIGSAGSWWLYNPSFPLLAVLTNLLCGAGIVGVQMVGAIWLADICDYDEWLNGWRREGILSSVKALIYKSLIAVASGFSGVLIVLAGVNVGATEQTPETIRNIRILFSIVPAAFAALATWFTVYYPLTRSRMNEIRAGIPNP